MKKYLLLLYSCFVVNAFAQIEKPYLLLDEDLDYYLAQSFLAKGSKERISINHIGLQGEQKSNGFLVTAVLEGYPAHVSGINRGDIITRVNDTEFHPVKSFNIRRDDHGNFVPTTKDYLLSLTRGSRNLQFTVRPIHENLFDSYRTATSNSVLEFSAGNKIIGYIRFWGLSRTTNDLINYQNILKSLDHTDGIIFDLRNSFGFLDPQHLDLVFTNRDSYFKFSDRMTAETKFAEISPKSDIEPYRKPIAVLLNQDTRGGSELFAYQLEKLGRVVSLGESTKGELGDFNLENNQSNSSITYIISNKLLINGQSLEGVGIQPERVVSYPYENTTRGDPQYEAAINTLLGII